MKEISLNILDIAENSVKAGASLTQILIDESGNQLTLSIIDNGCGMSPEVVKSVVDPFYTTRTTRKVGMGVPLLKLACEQTGGNLAIESVTEEADPVNHGTKVVATFFTDHIDFTPLGDVTASIVTLIQGHPDTDFLFRHTKNGASAADSEPLSGASEEAGDLEEAAAPEEADDAGAAPGVREVSLDTRELRQILEDVPLNSFDVIQWIESFLQEQYEEFERP